MFSNFRYPAILFILSFLGLTLGMVFKFMHWPGGQMLTGSMIIVQVIAIVWLLILLLRNIKP